MTCTFTSLEFNSTDTIITDINGSLTDRDSGNPISGTVSSDTYQFSGLRAGDYALTLDIGYTIYYENNSSEARNTRIADSFEVNGNVDKTYQLK